MVKFKFHYLLFFVLGGCYEKFPYEIGTFPEGQPTNLLEINSEFDEMNSDFVPSTFSTSIDLIFSSNVSSRGDNFNLEAKTLGFFQSKETYDFSFIVSSPLGTNQNLRNQLFEINSDCDERGPYTYGPREGRLGFKMFSSDCDGYSQIFLNEFENFGQFEGYRSETFHINLLDQDSNEMYPTFYGLDYLKGELVVGGDKPEKLLFSSDRDGTFDIYEVELPSNQSVIQFLTNEQEKQGTKIGINTSSNDHMPFVYGDLLVFSSDRLGGFGGYDLYYAMKTADGWTDPINFGEKINSEFDEYRPVVSDHSDFDNRLMIFSSNRPGGLGGFDLYFVGVPKF